MPKECLLCHLSQIISSSTIVYKDANKNNSSSFQKKKEKERITQVTNKSRCSVLKCRYR